MRKVHIPTVLTGIFDNLYTQWIGTWARVWGNRPHPPSFTLVSRGPLKANSAVFLQMLVFTHFPAYNVQSSHKREIREQNPHAHVPWSRWKISNILLQGAHMVAAFSCQSFDSRGGTGKIMGIKKDRKTMESMISISTIILCQLWSWEAKGVVRSWQSRVTWSS